MMCINMMIFLAPNSTVSGGSDSLPAMPNLQPHIRDRVIRPFESVREAHDYKKRLRQIADGVNDMAID